ncbi:RNA-directed DNA polymerase, eukaryota [Tanacetum coccineum]
MAPSDKKAKKDKWSEEQTLALCDFLNKYINEHGRNARFIWVELQPKFATLYNRTFASEKALKNKFDGMKRDYNLWKSLKNGEMGLGWNASAQKLIEDPNFKKLQKKKLSLELQYAWDQLFGDAVAGGEDCISSAMNIKAFQEVYNENAKDEDVESDDDLDDTQEGLPWILKKRKKIKKLHFIDILLDMINDTDIVVEYYFKHMYKEPCMTSQQKGEDWMKDVLNGIFVYILALGVSNRDVGERFQRSGETISRAFHDVLDAITAKGNGFDGLASDIIRPKDPSFPVPPQIMNDKRYMSYFKDCIGCIDGTHIGACIPEAQQVRYIGRKGIPTFNVMAAVRYDVYYDLEQSKITYTDELHDACGLETNTENVSQGTSNEMKRIRDDIAASIWNAQSFKIIVKGKVYMVRAKELFTWNPVFMTHKEKDCNSDGESVIEPLNNNDNEEEFDDEYASDVNEVPETVLGANSSSNIRSNGSVAVHQSDDPFGLYDLLNKKKAGETRKSSPSLSHPPGFTPEILEDQNDNEAKDTLESLNAKVMGSSQEIPIVDHNDQVSQKGINNGGSVLGVMEDVTIT